MSFLWQSNHLNENVQDKDFLKVIMEGYGIKPSEIGFSLDKDRISRLLELEEITIALDLLLTLTNVDFHEINPHYNHKPL